MEHVDWCSEQHVDQSDKGSRVKRGGRRKSLCAKMIAMRPRALQIVSQSLIVKPSVALIDESRRVNVYLLRRGVWNCLTREPSPMVMDVPMTLESR